MGFEDKVRFDEGNEFKELKACEGALRWSEMGDEVYLGGFSVSWIWEILRNASCSQGV